MRDDANNLRRSYRIFVMYCLIGGFSALLDFGVYGILVTIGRFHYLAANAVGYLVGLIASFFLNANYNFRTRDRLVSRFSRFCRVALVGWITSSCILTLAIGQLNVGELVAKVAAMVIVLLIQYTLNRIWTFREAVQ